MHQRRVPRMFYDYVDSGSWTESTYRSNEADLQHLTFRQRVAIDVSSRNTAMPMLGAGDDYASWFGANRSDGDAICRW